MVFLGIADEFEHENVVVSKPSEVQGSQTETSQSICCGTVGHWRSGGGF